MTVAENIADRVSRRALLTAGLAGGFLLAFHLPVRAAVNEPVQPPDVTDGKFAPNAFIRIDVTGHTTLVMPQVEMGQGVYTSIAMILAEELDADLKQVTLQHAPPNDKLYGNPTFGLQVTGNSNSIRAFWKPLRNAGAGARAMLVQAAAQQWQVEPASCTTANGEVTHKESGRKLSYGALAAAASGQTPPKDVPLKDPKNFTLIGTPLKRFDRILARGRSQQQRVRRRMFHGRACPQGGQGPGGVPPLDAREKAASAGSPQSRGGKIQLGSAAAGARRARRVRAAVVRNLHRDGGRS